MRCLPVYFFSFNVHPHSFKHEYRLCQSFLPLFVWLIPTTPLLFKDFLISIGQNINFFASKSDFEDIFWIFSSILTIHLNQFYSEIYFHYVSVWKIFSFFHQKFKQPAAGADFFWGRGEKSSNYASFFFDEASSKAGGS